MPRATPRAAAASSRRWGSRFDVIARSSSTDTSMGVVPPTSASESASIVSETDATEDEKDRLSVSASIATSTGRAYSESAFGGDEDSLARGHARAYYHEFHAPNRHESAYDGQARGRGRGRALPGRGAPGYSTRGHATPRHGGSHHPFSLRAEKDPDRESAMPNSADWGQSEPDAAAWGPSPSLAFTPAGDSTNNTSPRDRPLQTQTQTQNSPHHANTTTSHQNNTYPHSADPTSSYPFSEPHTNMSAPARRPPRWNHNASVFVAALPPEPNAELDTLLRSTLGQHGTILNIKFIHDVRSGGAANCAFVQFEHPEEAKAAIQACHMTWMQGRCIRCEPAKAHRTLLVSFRPPAFVDGSSDAFGANGKKHPKFTNIDPKTGLDPADTSPEWVRVRRPDARTHFIVVTFNQVALNFVATPDAAQYSQWANENDSLSGPGALISLSPDVPKTEVYCFLPLH
ncbi:hypothetical protein DL93DRAFT_2086934 [Clavulina sp. PMI_390]|nr:hypothetical protein DL93DRAFT_2086934 [Clavulina sp. PMI_390]